MAIKLINGASWEGEEHSYKPIKVSFVRPAPSYKVSAAILLDIWTSTILLTTKMTYQLYKQWGGNIRIPSLILETHLFHLHGFWILLYELSDL